MPISFFPSGAPWVALDGLHCGSYFSLAILCIGTNEGLCGGRVTPLFAEMAGLFEGVGWFLSGVRTTSCEAWVRCASTRKVGHPATKVPAPTLRGQRQRLLP